MSYRARDLDSKINFASTAALDFLEFHVYTNLESAGSFDSFIGECRLLDLHIYGVSKKACLELLKLSAKSQLAQDLNLAESILRQNGQEYIFI